jgi:hypothetical protein
LAFGTLVLDPTGEPTPRLRARVVREELELPLECLRLLEGELKQRPDHDLRERVRVDQVTVAVEHLDQAMKPLELASRE